MSETKTINGKKFIHIKALREANQEMQRRGTMVAELQEHLNRAGVVMAEVAGENTRLKAALNVMAEDARLVGASYCIEVPVGNAKNFAEALAERLRVWQATGGRG